MNKKLFTCILFLLFLTVVAVGEKRIIDSNIAYESTRITKSAEDTNAENHISSEPTTKNYSSTKTNETLTESSKSYCTTNTILTTLPKEVESTKATEALQSKNSITGFEFEMLSMVNELRINEDVPSLKLDSNLNALAQLRAREISEGYNSAHTRPDGSLWNTVLDSLNGTSLSNWRKANENIAYAQTSVESVMNAFGHSSIHYAEIINPDYTHVGFGCYEKNGVLFWVQIFIGL